MGKYRKYSDQEKAEALIFVDACNGNYKQASLSTGVPWTTLREWHKGNGVNEPVAEFRSEKGKALADRLDEKINLLVDCIDHERIADANLVQITTAMGTLIDKVANLRKPQAMTREELAEQQQQILTILKRYVSDPDILKAIGDDFDRLSSGDSGEAGSV